VCRLGKRLCISQRVDCFHRFIAPDRFDPRETQR
jgi:hypothetical protein